MDYEAQGRFNLTVTAADAHGQSDTAAVTVNLNNVEEPGTLVLSHEKLMN